ncbi:MAG: RHS repeat-associated core domain-containing protein [Treponema sp.]
MWTLHTDRGNNVYGGQFAKNIYLGESRIVTKLSGRNETTTHEEYYKYYYRSDHLGSASLISDYKGDEYQRIEYAPYGETWVEKTNNTGSEYLPYKFTAKEIDEETRLYYYGARYLDPKYSRWISTEPAFGEYIPQRPRGR